MASFDADQTDVGIKEAEENTEAISKQEDKNIIEKAGEEPLQSDLCTEINKDQDLPAVDENIQELPHRILEGIKSADSAFHIVSRPEAEIHHSSLELQSNTEDISKDKEKKEEQEPSTPAFASITHDAAQEMSVEMAEENELLSSEEGKKPTMAAEIDDAQERALLADDDVREELTRHLNEDMDISQTSSDAKEVSDFNFLKPNNFTPIAVNAKESSTLISNMENDGENDSPLKKAPVHPHMPEKVFNIDEETRMSLDQTPVDSTSMEGSFIYPSLPPKKLFHIDDTKDSDLSDVETKMSTMTDTEDIRLSHTISVDDVTKDSAASDSNAEPPVTKKPRRSSKENLGISIVDGIDAGKVFGAENVFEYQWPQDGGEWHLLQEQISEYLKVKSFKRKYPDLYRRICDKEEKDFLRDKGVVTETQSDLGLTALRSEEVYDLMMKDYNDKYKEYIAHLQEKQKKVIREKHKEYSAAKLDKSKIESYSKKAARSAAEFNASLMRDRKEERRAYFDLQTFTVHFPKHKFKVADPKTTKVGAYPVSLIPGQYQEHYKKYTSEEMKYLPLKTTLYDPPKLFRYVRPPPAGIPLVNTDKQKSKLPGSEGEDNDSSSEEEDDNENDEASQNETLDNSKCTGTDDLDSPLAVRGVDKKIKSALKKKVSKFLLSPERLKKYGKKPKDGDVEKTEELLSPDGEEKGVNSASKMPNKIHGLEKCRICKKRSTKEERRDGKLVKCAQCGKIGHMSCLDLTEELVAVIKTYPWQCMECKTCIECQDPFDEDKMMFCDRCDRGYHTFCIGLSALPTGHWECKSCEGCPAIIKSERKKIEQPPDPEFRPDEMKMDLTLMPGEGQYVITDVDDKANVLAGIEQVGQIQEVVAPDVKVDNVQLPVDDPAADKTPVKVERRGRKRKIVDPANPETKPPVQVKPVKPGIQGARQSKRLKLKEEEEEERKKKEMEEKKLKKIKRKKKLAEDLVVADGGGGVDDQEGTKEVVDEGVDDSMAILFDRNEDEEVNEAVTDSSQLALNQTLGQEVLSAVDISTEAQSLVDNTDPQHQTIDGKSSMLGDAEVAPTVVAPSVAAPDVDGGVELPSTGSSSSPPSASPSLAPSSSIAGEATVSQPQSEVLLPLPADPVEEKCSESLISVAPDDEEVSLLSDEADHIPVDHKEPLPSPPDSSIQQTPAESMSQSSTEAEPNTQHTSDLPPGSDVTAPPPENVAPMEQ